MPLISQKHVSIGFEFVTFTLEANVKTGPIKLQAKTRSSPFIFYELVPTVANLTFNSLQSLYTIPDVSLLLSKP